MNQGLKNLKRRLKRTPRYYQHRFPANLFLPHDFETRVETVDLLPRILIEPIAFDRMWHYVDICDTEVGWLGTVTRTENEFLIEEVFLFKQEAHYTNCEITPQGLAEFAEEILSSRADGIDVLNKLCFWGHSHVHMHTSPSTQDEEQMRLFAESGHPYFIRGILNKNGRMEFTIFLYDKGLRITDAEWGINRQIDQSDRKQIEEEIKSKVSRSYTYSRGYDLPGFGQNYQVGVGQYPTPHSNPVVADSPEVIPSFDIRPGMIAGGEE